MKPFVLFSIFFLFLSVVSAGSLSTVMNPWDKTSGTLSSELYTGASDVTNGVYGTIWTRNFSNVNSGADLNLTLYDEAGTLVSSVILAAGSSSYSRTINTSTYGRITMTSIDAYLTGGTMANSDLVSWIRFDEGTGNTSVDQKSLNNMTLNDTAVAASWTTGKVNNATNLAGTNYATLAESESLNFSAYENWSIFMWACFNGAYNNTYLWHDGNVSNTSDNATETGVYAKLHRSNTTNSTVVTLFIARNSTNISLTYTYANNTEINDSSTCKSFEFVLNGTDNTTSIFLNGANVASNTSVGDGTTIDLNSDINIGNQFYANNTAYLTAYVDELYVFNDTLNSSERTYLANQYKKNRASYTIVSRR